MIMMMLMMDYGGVASLTMMMKMMEGGGVAFPTPTHPHPPPPPPPPIHSPPFHAALEGGEEVHPQQSSLLYEGMLRWGVGKNC